MREHAVDEHQQLVGPERRLGAALPAERQARALNAYALTMSLAAVFGQSAGGALIQADLVGLGRRACFLINVPIKLATLALLPRVDRRAGRRARAGWTEPAPG